MKHGTVELVKNEEHERLFKEMRKTKRELLLASAIIKDFYILDPLGNPFRLSRILSNLAKNRVDVKILTTPKMLMTIALINGIMQHSERATIGLILMSRARVHMITIVTE